MKLFNFHTHNRNEEFGIINLFPDELPTDNKKYSIGIHPWYYDKNFDEKIDIIEKKLSNENVVAVGETGFDPKSSVNIEIQKNIFTKHVELAEHYKKPLIIHCVKFYNELISIKKSIVPTQAWVLHGFAGNLNIAADFIKHDFYFSISDQLLKNVEKSNNFLSILPTNRLFIETDDKNFDIEKTYTTIASRLGIDIIKLENIIANNLKLICL
jgi:TatD DNase family protein